MRSENMNKASVMCTLSRSVMGESAALPILQRASSYRYLWLRSSFFFFFFPPDKRRRRETACNEKLDKILIRSKMLTKMSELQNRKRGFLLSAKIQCKTKKKKRSKKESEGKKRGEHQHRSNDEFAGIQVLAFSRG
jgi:hypothetical protein